MELRRSVGTTPVFSKAERFGGRLGRSYPPTCLRLLPLPTIDQLKHQHSIQSVNTGRQFTIPSGRPGIVADDREKLNVITDQEGLLVFRSGVEFPLWTFRGQTAIHAPCVPGIARCDGPSQQFLAWCRNVAFVDALLAHPYVRHCRRVSFNGSQLRIHYQGIAQQRRAWAV